MSLAPYLLQNVPADEEKHPSYSGGNDSIVCVCVCVLFGMTQANASEPSLQTQGAEMLPSSGCIPACDSCALRKTNQHCPVKQCCGCRLDCVDGAANGKTL